MGLHVEKKKLGKNVKRDEQKGRNKGVWQKERMQKGRRLVCKKKGRVITSERNRGLKNTGKEERDE